MEPDTTRPTRIVLYVDDSEHWHAGAKFLGEFARTTQSHVTITTSLFLGSRRQRAMEKAKELLDLPPDRVTLLGKPGIIEHTIPSVARKVDADVVVVGRIGPADQLTSGLIAHLVAKRTPASVLIMRGQPKTIRRILVCTEGKRQGEASYECASHLAQALGARLDILHVVDKMALNEIGREELDDDLRDFLRSDATEAEHLRDLEQRLRTTRLEGGVIIRKGLVVEEILAIIHEGEHDILVLGAHDIAAPGANLYEDFASLILRQSPITTLVVRQRPHRPVNE